MHGSPRWRATADAWFKLLGAIVFAYLIWSQVVTILRQFADAAIILVGGVLLAYLVLPAVTWLRARLSMWAALATVYLGGALAIAAVFWLVIPIVSAQLSSLIVNLPQIANSVDRTLSSPTLPFLSGFPAPIRSWVRKLPNEALAALQNNAAMYTSSLFNALGALTFIGALVVAIPVVSIYLLAEAPMIRRFAIRRIPEARRRAVLDIAIEVDAVLGGFVRGQLIVAAVVGTLATIALLVLHVPYAVLIGVWAGVADVVPYVGPFAGALPAAVVSIIYNGWGSVIGVAVAFVAINQLEGHILGPRIVGRTVHVTPLAVIFALLICAQLFGFVGLIVAVPIAGLVRIALVRLFPPDQSTA